MILPTITRAERWLQFGGFDHWHIQVAGYETPMRVDPL